MRRLSITVLALAAVAHADPPVAAEQHITCKPVQAAVFPGSRVYVRCDKPWTNPSTSATASYFAIATSDATAPLVQAAGNTAMAAGKNVEIWFRTSSTENPGGCGTADCRKLTGIAVVN